jgi:hypothetical protein
MLSVGARRSANGRYVPLTELIQGRCAVEAWVPGDEESRLHPGIAHREVGEHSFESGQHPLLGHLPGWIRILIRRYLKPDKLACATLRLEGGRADSEPSSDLFSRQESAFDTQNLLSHGHSALPGRREWVCWLNVL